MKPLRGLPLLVAVLLLSSAPCHSAEDERSASSPAETPWSLTDVEITDGAAVVRGRLNNGLRYVIRPHVSPDRQLSLRLLVHAGSLHENDDERGFAHFVEHMAFNGTKHFPRANWLNSSNARAPSSVRTSTRTPITRPPSTNSIFPPAPPIHSRPACASSAISPTASSSKAAR